MLLIMSLDSPVPSHTHIIVSTVLYSLQPFKSVQSPACGRIQHVLIIKLPLLQAQCVHCKEHNALTLVPDFIFFSLLQTYRECTRGGFCNFMHLKPISRELRRELYGRRRKGYNSLPSHSGTCVVVVVVVFIQIYNSSSSLLSQSSQVSIQRATISLQRQRQRSRRRP